MFHLEAAGVDSRNLDLFFSGKDGIRDELSRHGADADLVVAEGVMGYYDGRSVGTEEGSSYDVARTLEMPVLLVVNGRGAALSLAALVSGMAAFRPDSNIRWKKNWAGPVLISPCSGIFRKMKPSGWKAGIWGW